MTTPLYSQIVTKVRDIIAGLSLTDMPAANVVVAKLPWARDMTMPGIRVCPEQDKDRESTNVSVDVDYGVWVVYCRVSNQDLTASLDVPHGWREAIKAVFESRSIVATMGIAEVYKCKVVPAVVESDPLFRSQYDVGALKVIVTTREAR